MNISTGTLAMTEYDTESPMLFHKGSDFEVPLHYGPRHNEILLIQALQRLAYKPPKEKGVK